MRMKRCKLDLKLRESIQWMAWLRHFAAWQATIISGEVHATIEPEVPQLPPEVKHYSKGRKRKQKRSG